ncbi:hypothetical protein VULLAG_LOCUS11293 [Vulpes lagopus]
MWLSREVEMCLLMKYGAPEKKWAWMLQDLPRTSSVMRHITFRCGCFDTDCPLGNVETWRQKQKGGSAVEHLLLAQDMTLGSQDRVSHQASCMEPASPSACVSASVSLCVSHE